MNIFGEKSVLISIRELILREFEKRVEIFYFLCCLLDMVYKTDSKLPPSTG